VSGKSNLRSPIADIQDEGAFFQGSVLFIRKAKESPRAWAARGPERSSAKVKVLMLQLLHI